ncbi:hypothetical protein ASPFODRAFT_61833 [Aspergillus luchuensis CBS 106.47]|uniref:Uncharacterized protein n=1 Tax=Aspergillus luchuensis (strain CBS 106.47) TaxID=1137211 RepID=A0A1M3TEG7_ASPLC|nr:hypothetical protein ASPFODRAFT_61833 [Aspergillus luchuensis CBS 106.47]
MAMADARYGDIDSIFNSRDGGRSAVGEKGKAPVECRHHLPTTSATLRIWSRVRCSGSVWTVPGNGYHFRLRFSLCRLERGRRELPKVGKSRSSERWGFRMRRGQNRVWLETAGPHWMGYS